MAQDKSHKQQNLLPLSVLTAVHIVGFLLATGIGGGVMDEAADWSKLGVASFVAAVAALFVLMINAQASDVLKARLVYLRWDDPLPGGEAFSKWMATHPNIDPGAVRAAVGELPESRAEQNMAWLQLYRECENQVGVGGASREYLLARDATFLGLIFTFVLGSAVWFYQSQIVWKLAYVLPALSFMLLTWRAARLNGIRLVKLVLARQSSPR
ncbi:hypothetical protein [Hyphomonas sp.]|uniref:hypothetical protein n=1 Tax=Hyphomonas sp. TaxID=87 RepID=UPI00300194E5